MYIQSVSAQHAERGTGKYLSNEIGTGPGKCCERKRTTTSQVLAKVDEVFFLFYKRKGKETKKDIQRKNHRALRQLNGYPLYL